MKSVKSVKWSLLAIAVLALGSLVFSVTIQQQNVVAFNDKNQRVFNHHDHSRITEDPLPQSNEGHAVNDETTHHNDNFNSNREDTEKTNDHSKPANGGVIHS